MAKKSNQRRNLCDGINIIRAGAILAGIGFILFVSCKPETRSGEKLISSPVQLGVEIFLERHLDLVRGKKVGLVTNPSGVTGDLSSIIPLFSKNPDIQLVALYGPEHGVRGNAQAGEYVPFYFDEKYKLPVFSLYGQSRKPEPGMLKDLDAYMRSFDTAAESKFPQKNMIKDLDVMIFDIQDVGTRIYTYVSTMAYCMQACAENDIGFIVLDRPNPVNGKDLEGPVLEYPEHSSFVGLYPIPLRHGMTVGELARLFNEEFFERKARLKVIPIQGWEREMWFDETGLPWVMPSPNMPTLDTAIVYPGQVFLEGTNISEGRGTAKPFELFGAPWIDGHILTKALNSLNLPGVKFREAWFIPVFSKYRGELCGGAQIHVRDRNCFRPFATTLHILKTVQDLYKEKFAFHSEYFDKIMGTSKVRESLEKGNRVEDILQSLEEELSQFSEKRKKYLLY